MPTHMRITHRQRLSFLCFVSFACHVVLAYVIWQSVGAFGDSPVWVVMGRLAPDIIWPILFMTQAAIALLGVYSFRAARTSFWFGALLMEWWAVASIIAWLDTGLPQPGAVLLFYVGLLKFMLAELLFREEKTAEAVQHITEHAREVAKDIDITDMSSELP